MFNFAAEHQMDSTTFHVKTFDSPESLQSKSITCNVVEVIWWSGSEIEHFSNARQALLPLQNVNLVIKKVPLICCKINCLFIVLIVLLLCQLN